MQSPVMPFRARRLDDVAEALAQRAAALSRLFLARTSIEISRTEAGVLGALSERARRITELAADEGATQPGITRLVDRLQARGWVARESDPGDGRAVVVRLTAAGQGACDTLRAGYRALVHEEFAALSDADVETLASTPEVLDALIARRGGSPATDAHHIDPRVRRADDQSQPIGASR